MKNQITSNENAPEDIDKYFNNDQSSDDEYSL
jgi:hypothetical protein